MGSDYIEIIPDLTRRTPVVDPDDHHMFVSIGCATENMSIASGASNLTCQASFSPKDGSVICQFNNKSKMEPSLFNAIPQRQSTRAEYDGRPVSATDLKILAEVAAVIPGVDMILITDRLKMNKVSDLVIAGNNVQMHDADFMRELKKWMRFNPREAAKKGDGLFSATTGNPILPNWLSAIALDAFFSAEAENKKYAQHLKSSSGVAIFVAHQENNEHWVQVGRACQRFALQATALGLKHAFVNQPVEVANLRPELAKLAGMSSRRPDIVMRFGYGPTMPFSARRPIQQVLT
jgi:hypothetical protein